MTIRRCVALGSSWIEMARNRHVANDMALDKLALPAISDADVLDVLRMWEFQSKKDLCLVFCSIIVNNLRVSKTNPITPPERVFLCYSKKTLSRHNPIFWELQSVLLDVSLLQLQHSTTQLSLVCLHAGSRTTCRPRLHSRFRLPPSL